MSRISVQNDIMYFYDDNENQYEILNCSSVNYINNNSSRPMQSGCGNISVMDYLINMYQTSQRIFQNSADISDYLIISGKIASVAYCTSERLKTVLIGNSDIILEWCISASLGFFNEESLLCQVKEDSIINNSDTDSDSLDSSIFHSRRADILTSYSDTLLEKSAFDIVFIDGSVLFDDPYKTIKEAERVLRENGCMFFYIKNNPILESVFRLIFSVCEEYRIADNRVLFFVEYKEGNSWSGYETTDINSEVNNLCINIEKCFSDTPDRNKLKEYADIADFLADKSVSARNYKSKIKLISIKESLLNYILNDDKEHDEYYLKKVQKFVCLDFNS